MLFLVSEKRDSNKLLHSYLLYYIPNQQIRRRTCHKDSFQVNVNKSTVHLKALIQRYDVSKNL